MERIIVDYLAFGVVKGARGVDKSLKPARDWSKFLCVQQKTNFTDILNTE